MRILMLANSDSGPYTFRREIIMDLCKKNEVLLACPAGQYVKKLEVLGCKCVDIPVDRHGTNPINDFSLFYRYYKLIKKYRPDVALTYTVKPNIYGGLACALNHIPYIPMITGTGETFMKKGLVHNIVVYLYRIGLIKASCVLVQNKTNMEELRENNIAVSKYRLICGSGVNTDQFGYIDYPKNDDTIVYLFLSRLTKSKGIDEFLYCARNMKEKYGDRVEFWIVGDCEGDYTTLIDELTGKNIIKFFGFKVDVTPYYEKCHVSVLPSYKEGMSNTLLESASSGRPVITSDIPGCRETFDDGITGFSCKVADVESLLSSMEKFYHLSYAEKKQMGIAGRRKMIQQFERSKVVAAYNEEINKIMKRGQWR